MAKAKFSKSDLSLQASQVKRTIINRAEKGIYLDKRLSKTEVLKMIAKNLKLSSHRSLYDSGEREEYINKWFQKLEEDIENINSNIVNFSENNIKIEKYMSTEELLTILEEERKLRRAYEQRIGNLMQENESLRIMKLNRFKKIDEV